MADETVVRVTADASGYKAELDKARSSADAFIAKQEEAARRTKAAQEAVAEAARNGSDASARAINAFVQQVARISDSAGKTRTQLLEQKAAQLGVTEAVADYLNKLKEVDRTASGGKKVQEALDNVGASARQTAAAMRMVPAQMTDIVTQLAGGQSPLLILTQQGGQLKDMFGGVVPAVRAVGTYVAALINPFTLTAAAAAALGYAFYAGTKEPDLPSHSFARLPVWLVERRCGDQAKLPRLPVLGERTEFADRFDACVCSRVVPDARRDASLRHHTERAHDRLARAILGRAYDGGRVVWPRLRLPVARRRLDAKDVPQDLPLDRGIVHAHHGSPEFVVSTRSARVAHQK